MSDDKKDYGEPEKSGDDERISNLPDQKELEKELAEYLSRKYGERVKIVSAGLFPQQALKEGKPEPGKSTKKKGFDFQIKPEELVEYLDQYVVKQEEAKTVLATKICTHFNRIRYLGEKQDQMTHTIGQIKSNVLLIGPTGVGKTYLIKLIANRIGVPFVKGDATKFSETGYVGGDVEDLVRDLVRQADGDIEKAQYGIIYVDEIDKIASSRNRVGADVSRTGVQRALLKPMEETEVDLKVPHDPISQIEAIEHYRATGKKEKRVVNTKNILFIMSGAFDGLEDIIRKRVQQQTIGFEGNIVSKKNAVNYISKVKAEDLIEYGFESEFVGRIPVLAILDQLSPQDLYEIVRNKNSSQVLGKKQDFMAYGIRILFEDKALRKIADLASQEQTGARGLMSVMEKVLLPFERKFPSSEVKEFTVTDAVVENSKEQLKRFLANKKVREKNLTQYIKLYKKEYEQLLERILVTESEYLEEHEVASTPERISLIARQVQEEFVEPRSVTDDIIEFIYQIHDVEKDMSQRCEMDVVFSEEAIDRLLAKQPRNLKNIKITCDALFSIFEYGFCLIHQKKGRERVIIPADGVDNPKKYIDRLVAETFQI